MNSVRKGGAHEVGILCLRTLHDKIVSQNAPDCISEHIYFKKFPGGGGGPMKLVVIGHS